MPNSVEDRLTRVAREFGSRAVGDILLRFDPELDPLDVGLFAIACIQQVRDIEQKLSSRLRPWWRFRPPLRVYLCRSEREVTEIFGSPAMGFACWNHWAIAVNVESNWQELLRHELAHIIGFNWNCFALTVLCEGLAVWSERCSQGNSIDQQASCFLGKHPQPMTFLLGPDQKYGTTERYEYYKLAGSFTGAMIERFGLPAYRQFYSDRSVTNENFAKRFSARFRVSVEPFVDEWLERLRGVAPKKYNIARQQGLVT